MTAQLSSIINIMLSTHYHVTLVS